METEIKPGKVKVQPDEVFAAILEMLKSGTPIEVIRFEAEAAHHLYMQVYGHQIKPEDKH